MKAKLFVVLPFLTACLPEIDLEGDVNLVFSERCVSTLESNKSLKVEAGSEDGSAVMAFNIQHAYDTLSEAIAIEQSFDLATTEANLDFVTGMNLNVSCMDNDEEKIAMSVWAAKSGLLRLEITPTQSGNNSSIPMFEVNLNIRNAVLSENNLEETLAIEEMTLSGILIDGHMQH